MLRAGECNFIQIRAKKETQSKTKRQNKIYFKLSFDFQMLKTSIELLCYSNERVNDLFPMYFVHGSEHESASV